MENTSRTIIVGCDSSPTSIAALRRGLTIAEALKTRLEVVAAWSYPLGFGGYRTDWSPKEDAQQQLDAALAEVLGESRPDWLSERLVEGPAAQVLIEASTDAEMLIVGSRGHGGFVGLLLGSVSAACAEHAHCPVLIMHESNSALISDPSNNPDYHALDRSAVLLGGK